MARVVLGKLSLHGPERVWYQHGVSLPARRRRSTDYAWSVVPGNRTPMKKPRSSRMASRCVANHAASCSTCMAVISSSTSAALRASRAENSLGVNTPVLVETGSYGCWVPTAPLHENNVRLPGRPVSLTPNFLEPEPRVELRQSVVEAVQPPCTVLNRVQDQPRPRTQGLFPACVEHIHQLVPTLDRVPRLPPLQGEELHRGQFLHAVVGHRGPPCASTQQADRLLEPLRRLGADTPLGRITFARRRGCPVAEPPCDDVMALVELPQPCRIRTVVFTIREGNNLHQRALVGVRTVCPPFVEHPVTVPRVSRLAHRAAARCAARSGPGDIPPYILTDYKPDLTTASDTSQNAAILGHGVRLGDGLQDLPMLRHRPVDHPAEFRAEVLQTDAVPGPDDDVVLFVVLHVIS